MRRVDELTPERFLEYFEYCNLEYPFDPQFSVGLPIIDEWVILLYRETVSQADLDGLLARFTRDAEGSPIADLWGRIVRWGLTRGLSAPDGHPWEPR